jgi:hypothetical protein
LTDTASSADESSAVGFLLPSIPSVFWQSSTAIAVIAEESGKASARAASEKKSVKK